MTYTVDDLTPYMQTVFEEAYQERDRKQASREDFAAGFLAALVAMRSRSSFRPDRWQE